MFSFCHSFWWTFNIVIWLISDFDAQYSDGALSLCIIICKNVFTSNSFLSQTHWGAAGQAFTSGFFIFILRQCMWGCQHSRNLGLRFDRSGVNAAHFFEFLFGSPPHVEDTYWIIFVPEVTKQGYLKPFPHFPIHQRVQFEQWGQVAPGSLLHYTKYMF